jgi:ubiquinone/menaquinone biosynthesis C-methylase UbiE
MSMHQRSYPIDLADMAEWVRSATAPGARVLDIGCGDGSLVERLAGVVDIVGVDPNAEPGPRVHATALEDFDAEPFDVVFASLSLHHMSDPSGAAAALRRLTKPGSIALVREFDKDLISDDRTLRWWFHQRLAKEAVHPDEKMQLTTDFADYVEQRHSRWYEHVHSWSVVEDLLTAAGFDRDHLEPMPFLFRWGLSDDIRPTEERLAATGAIKMTGVRWTGHRS